MLDSASRSTSLRSPVLFWLGLLAVAAFNVAFLFSMSAGTPSPISIELLGLAFFLWGRFLCINSDRLIGYFGLNQSRAWQWAGRTPAGYLMVGRVFVVGGVAVLGVGLGMWLFG